MAEPDLLVVGGGLAGSALAIRMASAGERVLLLERERGPHDKVCGEFLSREALLHLRELGLDPRHLGGVPIDRVSLVSGRRRAEAALPFRGVGLSRRVLDAAMLDRARAAGAHVRQGARVAALVEAPDGVIARLSDGDTVRAERAALATGKHDLRGHRRPAGWQNDLVGFKLHLRLAPDASRRLRGTVALVLFPGGYVGLQPVEDGLATLCLVMRRRRLGRRGTPVAAIRTLCGEQPFLADMLDGATALREAPLSVANIPYGLVPSAGEQGARIWRLGDQAAVIPSFTGDGMSIALHSAALAAAMMGAADTPATFTGALRRDVAARVRGATLLSLLAVRGPLQSPIVAAAAAVPALIGPIARATRIPDRALRRVLPLHPAG
ncbi:NAD(P)/FAD-dependent oxidoreductase [Rhizosaccharibacter radicis]|uniref:FAD-dependent monooxygenase n=1 Tax=Rhizosaccharibacter radicis TaxID=2782605 RepID=A0ABT1VVI6_9PROT|nr:FAD-dependent monooxygenase [Acetobacteraceae bacterium KSS12]